METSLKAMIQGLNAPEISLIEGTVVQKEPFLVQLSGDNITLSASTVTVPRHLTDYEVTCDIVWGDGEVEGETEMTANHIHNLASLEINAGVIKVCNALEKGDKVMLLSLNRGKKYYILDRVV